MNCVQFCMCLDTGETFLNTYSRQAGKWTPPTPCLYSVACCGCPCRPACCSSCAHSLTPFLLLQCSCTHLKPPPGTHSALTKSLTDSGVCNDTAQQIPCWQWAMPEATQGRKLKYCVIPVHTKRTQLIWVVCTRVYGLRCSVYMVEMFCICVTDFSKFVLKGFYCSCLSGERFTTICYHGIFIKHPWKPNLIAKSALEFII